MISLNIRSNIKDVVRELGSVPKDIQEKATARAINTTVRQARNDMARGISKEFRVGVTQAKERLSVTLAKNKRGQWHLEAMLEAKRPGGLSGNDYRGMNLIHFVKGGQRRLKNGRLSALKFQIKRTGGLKTLRGSFIATSKKTGGTAVFTRVGKERMPIETKTTIDVPQMFNTKRINQVIRQAMLDRFDKNFRRELRVVLQGWAK